MWHEFAGRVNCLQHVSTCVYVCAYLCVCVRVCVFVHMYHAVAVCVCVYVLWLRCLCYVCPCSCDVCSLTRARLMDCRRLRWAVGAHSVRVRSP